MTNVIRLTQIQLMNAEEIARDIPKGRGAEAKAQLDGDEISQQSQFEKSPQDRCFHPLDSYTMQSARDAHATRVSESGRDR
jgi:hypothetical protein